MNKLLKKWMETGLELDELPESFFRTHPIFVPKNGMFTYSIVALPSGEMLTIRNPSLWMEDGRPIRIEGLVCTLTPEEAERENRSFESLKKRWEERVSCLTKPQR